MSKQVAETILRQLGGRRFAVMTGAKAFTVLASAEGLSFRLPGGGGFCKSGINRVKIVLTAADLYDVQFSRVRANKEVVVAEKSGCYAEDLIPVFERETGLVARF